MALVDPMELLLALEPFLGDSGQIKHLDDIDKITGFMEKADNLVGKCVYVNVLQATKSEDILAKFIEAGGWDLLNAWLQQAKQDDNTPFLLQLLALYVHMPVSVSLLKSNNCAKTIKSLAKNDESELKSLSATIVEKWMARIRELRDNTDDQDDKKDKKSDKSDKSEKSDKSDKSERGEKDNKKEKHNDHHHHHHSSSSSDRKDKDRHRHKDSRRSSKSDENKSSARKSAKNSEKSSKSEGKKEEEREAIVIRVSKQGGVTKVTSSPKPRDKEDKNVKRPSSDSLIGANLKNIKIPKLSDKNKSSGTLEKRPGVVDHKERPKTVKTFNSKFRSTGLEQTPPPPSKRKSEDDKTSSFLGSKKLAASTREDKNRPSPSSLSSSSSSSSSSSDAKRSSTDKSRLSPSQDAKKPAPSPNDKPKVAPSTPTDKQKSAPSTPSAEKAKGPPGTPGTPTEKKAEAPSPSGEKKKLQVAAVARTSSTESNGGSPAASSPTDNGKKPLSVKRTVSHEMHESTSFMDALMAPTTAPVKKKRKLVPQKLAKDAQREKKEGQAPEPMESELKSNENSNDSSKSSEPSATPEAAAEVGTIASQPGKKKKKVTWVDDSKLRQFHYFDMDETERVNVNRMREPGDMKKADMLMDREAMDSAKRLARDKMREMMQWRRPSRLSLPDQSFIPGENSNEKLVQAKRELAVLQAIYFHKHMIPDSPAEPDMTGPIEVSNPRIIPTEEVTEDGPAPQQAPPPPPAGPAPADIVQGSGLRPDVANLLSQLTGGPQSSPSQPESAPTNQLASLIASVSGQPANSSPSQQPAHDATNIIGSIQTLLQSYQQSGEEAGKDRLTEQLKHILHSTLSGQGQNGPPAADMLAMMGPMMAGGPPMGLPPGLPPMDMAMPPFPPSGPMYRGPMPPLPAFGMGPPPRGPPMYDDRPGWQRDRGPPPRGDRFPRDRGPRNRGPRDTKRMICWNYKNGKGCSYGPTCQFRHIDG